MAQINPHINFNGNAEEAFTFYKSVFGGEFAKVVRFKDIASPQFPIAQKDENKIMHIALQIGNNVLMANDVPDFLGTVNERENRSKISVSTESKEESHRVFNGLSVGGEVEMPLEESPEGYYFGMFRDKYGIEWMVEFDAKSYRKRLSEKQETPNSVLVNCGYILSILQYIAFCFCGSLKRMFSVATTS